MKRKYISFLLLSLMTSSIFIYSQSDTIDYFGQTFPGNNPINFNPTIIDTLKKVNGDYLERIIFSKDGNSCYFHFVNYDQGTGIITMSTFKIDDSWQSPMISFITQEYQGRSPALSPTGDTILFAKGPGGSRDIYLTEKKLDSWSEPVKLPAPYSTTSDENYVCYTSTGNVYFGSDRNEKTAVYKTNLTAPECTVTEMTNWTYGEFFVSPDENYIVFGSSERFDANYGLFDIYVTYKKENGLWTYPKNCGPKVNSSNHDYAPSISPDSMFIFYTTTINSQCQIRWFSTDYIQVLKNTNFAPYKLNSIPDQTVEIGTLYNYIIPDTIFFDDDGNETLTITASLSNGNDLPDSLTFNSETKTISGKLIEAGNYNIKITATDTAEASISDIFRLVVKPFISVNEMNTIADNIRIFPNPANQIIQIRINSLLVNDISYQLCDMGGRIVSQGTINSEIIDISSISKGIYILNLRTDKVIFSKMVSIE